MSVFLCSDLQFQVVAQWASVEVMHGEPNSQVIADILKRENIRSVNYAHKQKARFASVRFVSLGDRFYNAADIVSLCHCIEYQSCELADWNKTQARQVLLLVQHVARLKAHIQNLPVSNLWSI